MALPREVIKPAFQAGLVDDGEVWLDMLDSRNKLAHTYQEAIFKESVAAVRKTYYPCIRDVVYVLQEKA